MRELEKLMPQPIKEMTPERIRWLKSQIAIFRGRLHYTTQFEIWDKSLLRGVDQYIEWLEDQIDENDVNN